jgi:bifunctional non-homologous end joining protein LigD
LNSPSAALPPSTRSDTAKASAEALRSYSAKRSFATTPEPAPAPAVGRTGPLLFVVQQHAARRLHFDFRLECDGVLKSWAVPKGPTLDASERRLAAPTEDHPFDYASFEGVIPPKQYGAGQVIVWDCGIYSPDEDRRYSFTDRAEAEARVRTGLAEGKLSIFLCGEKLKGSFALVRTSGGDWLLLKHRDRFVRAPYEAVDLPHSVLSGRTVEDLKHEPVVPRLPAAAIALHGPPEALPRKLAPMLASLRDQPVSGPDWLFEPKLDGYRVIAVADGTGVKLHSRRGLDLTAPFPEIVSGLAQGLVAPAVVDGELVALGKGGRPSFNALQNRAQCKTADEIGRAARESPCVLVCFDLLHFAGVDVRSAPYESRRRYLKQCLLASPHVQIIDVSEDGNALYQAALATGFEGVVAKRRASRYETGVRSPQWVKVKATRSDEFYIGGYTAGQGSRAKQFGALLLGSPDGEGKLEYVGNVGSGFDDALLAQLMRRFEPLETKTCPFKVRPKDVRAPTWLVPELVCEVKYAEWTPDGRLRWPVFLRLRDDAVPEPIAPGARDKAALARRASVPSRDPDDAEEHDADAMPDAATEAKARLAKGGRAKGRNVRRAHIVSRSGEPRDAEQRDIEHRGIERPDARRDARGPETEPRSKWAAIESDIDPGSTEDERAELLERLDAAREKTTLEIGGHRVSLTSLDKVLWPADRGVKARAFTKRDFLRYLVRVSPFMLPHLADRPVTMIRMPEGILGQRFYQKHWDQRLPPFVHTITIFSESKTESTSFLLCNNLATLVWLGQNGTLEFHVTHSRANPAPDQPGAGTDYASSIASLKRSILNRPDFVVFDIDPYIYSGKEAQGAEPEFNTRAFSKGKEVALWLKEALDGMGVPALVKTSGKTGLHVFVPIVRTLDFDTARNVSETVGRYLMKQHPRDITLEWAVNKRTGKIFMDYNMNVRGKTLNSAYSPRGVAGAPISMPVTWDELPDVDPRDFRLDNVCDRLERQGDVWRDALAIKRRLEGLFGAYG